MRHELTTYLDLTDLANLRAGQLIRLHLNDGQTIALALDARQRTNGVGSGNASPARRRAYSDEEKAQAIQRMAAIGTLAASRELGVHNSLLYHWRKEFRAQSGGRPRVNTIKTRREFTAEEKARIVAERKAWKGSGAEFARHKGIDRSVIERWVKEAAKASKRKAK